MTASLIIVGIIAVLLGIFLISNRMGVSKLTRENNEICDAHKKIGYPELKKDVQCRIIETGDLSPIAQLIPELSSKVTPIRLLKHYIKISKIDFKEYLLKSEFLDKHKLENAPNIGHDGIWIRANEIIDQERGYIRRSWKIANDNEAIDIYGDLLWEKITFFRNS